MGSMDRDVGMGAIDGDGERGMYAWIGIVIGNGERGMVTWDRE
jgi:hypothetical protein